MIYDYNKVLMNKLLNLVKSVIITSDPVSFVQQIFPKVNNQSKQHYMSAEITLKPDTITQNTDNDNGGKPGRGMSRDSLCQ